MKTQHPGSFIRRRFLEPMNISAQELASAMSVSESNISRILNEKIAVTSDMSVRLGHVLGVSPDLFVNMQTEHDVQNSIQSIEMSSLRVLNKK